MYAVIFKAEIAFLNSEYYDTAKKLRTLAIDAYGCQHVSSAIENAYEITISYWERIEDFKAFKADSFHEQAQKKGKQEWFTSYSVEIVQLLSSYSS